MLKGDYLWQGVESVIGCIPIGREIDCMYSFMSRGGILLHGSVSTIMFGPMGHQVDHRKVVPIIYFIRNLYSVDEIIPPGIHFASLSGWCPSFIIWFLVYLSHLQECCSKGIGFFIRLFASSPEQDNIFEDVTRVQHVLPAAQCCIIVRYISSIHIAF